MLLENMISLLEYKYYGVYIHTYNSVYKGIYKYIYICNVFIFYRWIGKIVYPFIQKPSEEDHP